MVEPNKWTPLQFGSSKKNYLTPEWGTKNKGILSDNDFTELINMADQLFPSDIQYEYEMKQTQEITQNLTQEQKHIGLTPLLTKRQHFVFNFFATARNF